MPFLAVKENLYIYFAMQLGIHDWRGKDVLDFGGNIGGLLHDPTHTIDESRYWCMDIIPEAIEIGRRRFPSAHWVHYDKYNFFFNPHGNPDVGVPEVGRKFDIIAAYSVVTNNSQADTLELIPQLERMLAPGGVLAFTFLDPHYRLWPKVYGGTTLKWRLDKCVFERPDRKLDVDGMVARAQGAKWCILVNDRELYVDTHDVPEYPADQQETFHMYYSKAYMASLFPHATILDPVNCEHHHCCVIRAGARADQLVR